MAELMKTHTPEEVAESLCRLDREAMRILAPEARPLPEWPRLSIETQLYWLGLARGGPKILEACEGQPIREAARRLFLSTYPEGQLVSGDALWSTAAAARDRQVALFEMLTRHLALLMDCDEAGSLAEAEALMLDWFGRRVGENRPEAPCPN